MPYVCHPIISHVPALAVAIRIPIGDRVRGLQVLAPGALRFLAGADEHPGADLLVRISDHGTHRKKRLGGRDG